MCWLLKGLPLTPETQLLGGGLSECCQYWGCGGLPCILSERLEVGPGGRMACMGFGLLS
jgi:hypothetical protein